MNSRFSVCCGEKNTAKQHLHKAKKVETASRKQVETAKKAFAASTQHRELVERSLEDLDKAMMAKAKLTLSEALESEEAGKESEKATRDAAAAATGVREIAEIHYNRVNDAEKANPQWSAGNLQSNEDVAKEHLAKSIETAAFMEAKECVARELLVKATEAAACATRHCKLADREYSKVCDYVKKEEQNLARLTRELNQGSDKSD